MKDNHSKKGKTLNSVGIKLSDGNKNKKHSDRTIIIVSLKTINIKTGNANNLHLKKNELIRNHCVIFLAEI